MAIFARIRYLLRAHLHGRWQRDPERALQRMCHAVEARLQEGQAELSANELEERRLAALAADAEWIAAQMLAFARKALHAQREDLAREAMARHQQALRQAQTYAEYRQRQQQLIVRLRQVLELLEIRLADMEFRRCSLATRRRLADLEFLLLQEMSGERVRLAVAAAEEQVRTDEYANEANLLLDDPGAITETVSSEQVEYRLLQLKDEMQQRM